VSTPTIVPNGIDRQEMPAMTSDAVRRRRFLIQNPVAILRAADGPEYERESEPDGDEEPAQERRGRLRRAVERHHREDDAHGNVEEAVE